VSAQQDLLDDEPRAAGPGLRLEPAVVLLSASVLPVVWRYYGSAQFFQAHVSPALGGGQWVQLYGVLYSFAACFLLMLVVPVLVGLLVLKRGPGCFGTRLGDWKAGLTIVAALLPLVAVLLLWPSSRQADFRAEYPLFRQAGRTLGLFVAYELLYAVYYLGWEYFFRGFMLFGLKDAVGAANAVLISTIPSTILHIGKPAGEVFAAVVAGVVFGFVAIRTRSWLYVFLLHWLIGVGLDVLIVLSAS
jgi:membrane protease YdiL (CAAX protease family)